MGNEKVSDFIEFLSSSPSSYHAAAEVARRLDAAGFTALTADEEWALGAGGYYYALDGAIVAWRVPGEPDASAGFRVVAAHTDSPTLKLKLHPEQTNYGFRQVGMECYGGLLLNSWLDRELGLAGRLANKNGDVKLVRTGSWLRVPQLAIHMDRGVNDGLKLDRQRHMLPVSGIECGDVLPALAAEVGWTVDDLAGFDVYAYPTQAPAVFGQADEFIASNKLDNLASCHQGLLALLEAENPHAIAVLACFDHEEIGSATTTGAAGPLLENVLRRIAIALGAEGQDWYQLVAASSCLSSDVAHSVHPNYADKHDPKHLPLINGGPVLKVNANQRYATDAPGMAIWRAAVDAAGVPHQVFIANNSSPCGSTVGPITATRLGIRTIDVGAPILSMHSAREMAGVRDTEYMSAAMREYFLG